MNLQENAFVFIKICCFYYYKWLNSFRHEQTRIPHFFKPWGCQSDPGKLLSSIDSSIFSETPKTKNGHPVSCLLSRITPEFLYRLSSICQSETLSKRETQKSANSTSEHLKGGRSVHVQIGLRILTRRSLVTCVFTVASKLFLYSQTSVLSFALHFAEMGRPAPLLFMNMIPFELVFIGGRTNHKWTNQTQEHHNTNIFVSNGLLLEACRITPRGNFIDHRE